MELSPLELARVAYAAYGGSTDYKNYRGLPMPEWDELGEAIQSAWITAVVAVRANVVAGGE